MKIFKRSMQKLSSEDIKIQKKKPLHEIKKGKDKKISKQKSLKKKKFFYIAK